MKISTRKDRASFSSTELSPQEMEAVNGGAQSVYFQIRALVWNEAAAIGSFRREDPVKPNNFTAVGPVTTPEKEMTTSGTSAFRVDPVHSGGAGD